MSVAEERSGAVSEVSLPPPYSAIASNSVAGVQPIPPPSRPEENTTNTNTSNKTGSEQQGSNSGP